MVVGRVEYLTDDLCHSALLHGAHIFPFVKQFHIQTGGFGAPQAQDRNAFPVLPRNHQVVGNGFDDGSTFVLDIVMATVPPGDDFAVKGNIHRLFGVVHKPHLATGKPEVGGFGLPAVHDPLTENAVLIANGVAHGRVTIGCQTVQIASRQTTQTPVAQTGVGFLIKHFIQFYVKVRQGLREGIHQP